MSVFQFASVGAEPVNVPVTGNSPTDIVSGVGDGVVYVPWFEVNHHVADSTPTLTVEVYDGTNSRYLGDDNGQTWNARTISGAQQSVKFTKGYAIPKGSKLRVTSSHGSGQMHVIGLKIQRQ